MSLVLSGLYRFDEFELNPARRAFLRNGKPVFISPKAFEVLTFLVANAGRVVTKDELLKAVWPESFVEESNLTQHIFALRKAMADRAGCIVTIPGRGYQFTAQVEETHPEARPAAPPPVPADESPAPPVPQPAPVAPARPAIRNRPQRLAWGLIAAAVLALAALLFWRLNRPSILHIAAYQQITHDGREKSIGGTDGSRVYFTEELPHSIAQVSVSGGVVDPIPIAVNEPWAGDVSPDGSTLLVISQSGGMGPADSLWTFHLVGGALRKIASGAIDSTWSPDGSRLAYATATGEIVLMRTDGTGQQRLAAPGGYIRSLAWSPDGTRLRFSRDGVLWELRADGSNLHQLLPGWSSSPSQFFGQWAQDGRYFFTSEGQIWVLDHRSRLGRIPAAKPLQLTFGPIGWDRPVVSRDGKTIFASGRTRRGELVRLDPKSKQFQPFLGGISAEFVAFSPDRKSVAYVTYPEGVLWRANADGTNPLQLTSPPLYPKSLRWSPAGTEILFVDRAASGANAIYIIAADGGIPRQILPNDRENETDPSWSPDGRRIVYSTCPTLGASTRSDLRILDLASRKSTFVPGSNGLVSPHWSPDGKSISAMTLDSISMKVFDLESQKWSALDTGSVAFPEWSHDSRFIYYLRWKGDAALVRIRPGGGSPEVLADVSDQHFTGFYTSWMNLDPTDAPLLLRDMGSNEIFALTLKSDRP